jgi:hypothetical protein
MPARLPYAARVPAIVAGIAAALLLALFAAVPVASAQGDHPPPAATGQGGAGAPLAGAPRVVIAFMPIPDRVVRGADDEIEPQLAYQPILDRLDARKQLSIGMSSAAQGQYDPIQAMLDITQGTRVSLSSYSPKRPQELNLYLMEGGGALFQGWLEVVARGDSAPAELVPGLLAGTVPGGAGYVGVEGRSQREAIAAADRSGRIAAVSLGGAGTLAARVREQLRTRRLVVAGLPTAIPGDVALDALIKQRRANELLIVMQTPPDRRNPQLLPIGTLGLGGPGELSSDTTHIDGIVAGIDVLPTALGWLHVPVPDTVKGQPIEVVPGRDAAALESRADRLRVVLPRRLPALWTLLGGWAAVLLAAALFADRRGVRWALRVGALAVLWVPVAVLITAALEPSRTLELVLVAALALAFAAATDALVGWPRGPALPALAALAAYVVDLAFGSPLIIRSLLGPNPLYGSRFYGIGNELEATLSALLLIGAGALLYGRGRSRAGVAAFAGGGVVLAIAIGAGRLGADVGGVITVAAGASVAALMMLPGGLTRRALALAIAAPLLALGALAAIDLATGGDSHFTRTVLRADDSGALWDVFTRRYELAGRAAVRGFMPAATAIALLAIACGLRYRERLLAPVRGDAAITAALGGTIAVGVGGALFNDSGPVLLLFATFIAACLVLYVRGDPRLAAPGADDLEQTAPAAPLPETPLEAGLASARPDPAHSAR